MGYTKDLWTRPETGPDGKTIRVRNERWGKGKRWLAGWLDPNGKERSQVFKTQAEADRHWAAMETDKQRGEYHDTNAGKVLFEDFGRRWLSSRIVDPSSRIRYETAYRLHVEPTFGRRQVRAIKPSQIQAWLGELSQRFEPSTPIAAFLVLQGVLDLAVADEAIKQSPAKSSVVQVPRHQNEEIKAWSDERVNAIIDAHPEPLRGVPQLGASCGLREGEIFGIALEDIDFDEQVIRVRRQLKNLGGKYVYALPKNDRDRVVPLPDWTAQVIKRHIDTYPARPYTLAWEKAEGKPRTHNLLFRWPGTDQHIRARTYSEQVWKPALVTAGVIPAPSRRKDAQRGSDGKHRTRRRYATTHKEGTHQLRHYYASVMLAGGVSIKELAEYLGHADPAFTLRVYAHLLPCSHQRARQAIDERLMRPRLVTGTEQI
jgi:integrase